MTFGRHFSFEVLAIAGIVSLTVIAALFFAAPQSSPTGYAIQIGSTFFVDPFDDTTGINTATMSNVSVSGGAVSPTGSGSGEINPSNPLGNGLVGLWHLNGNANDGTAFGQNASLTGPAVSCNATGLFGTQACTFSGGYVGDDVRVFFDSTKPVFGIDNAAPFTLSAWVYPLGLNYYAGIIGSHYG